MARSCPLPFRLIATVAALTVVSCASPPEPDPQELFGAAFAEDVDRILAHWSAPGVVMSVVRDGEVLLQGGFGATTAGGDLRPDAQTLAPVQSVTKPITSIAVGMLVDDGVLDWDVPIRTYVPEFEYGGEFISSHLTIRDLLSHRSGTPNFLPGGFWRQDLTGPALIRELADANPEAPFRDFLNYSQVGMGVIGVVIERQTGLSWSEVVKTRILDPLGMTSSFADTPQMTRAHGPTAEIRNLLRPAIRDDGQVRERPWRLAAPAYCPAGCVVTTAEDMTRLMAFVLSGGVSNGARMISSESLREPMTPHTIRVTGVITDYLDGMNPTSSLIAFGMGWAIHEIYGHTIFEHAGSGQGSSVMAVVPSARLGVFVSSNATYSTDSDRMVSALKFLAMEEAMRLPHTDWIEVLDPGEL